MPADEREKMAREMPASFPSTGGAAVSAQEKREALEEVLSSERFSRAEQLRNFLRYICEMELAGRGGELCEALIGVEALGRPADYTPAEDASVRRRASDLREKLQDVYAAELAGSRVRIELPKGKYVPRFVRVETESGADALLTLTPAKIASTATAAKEQSQQAAAPVAAALSPLPAPSVIATRIGSGVGADAIEAAHYRPDGAWWRPAIFWLSVGWVLGALMVAVGFSIALWVRPARTETASPQPIIVGPAMAPAPAPAPAVVEPGTTYEAEASTNTFHYPVRTYPCRWCSGGARVRYIGKSERDYLTINDIHVARAGNYEMVIFYVVEGTRVLFISVNDGPERKLRLSGKSWREAARVSVNVPLVAGSNKVKFYNNDDHAPDIDRIVIR
jgi:hypothetical protein